jgi:hypothetical protein
VLCFVLLVVADGRFVSLYCLCCGVGICRESVNDLKKEGPGLEISKQCEVSTVRCVNTISKQCEVHYSLMRERENGDD